MVGNNNKVEIWSAKVWDESQAEQDELFANRDEEVIPGIF
jgi:MraZ protein